MDNPKHKPEEILEYCDVINSDDGVSTYELAKKRRKQQRSASFSNRCRYRLSQLCGQVRRGIDDAFWCDLCDPLLSDLRTIEVKPIEGSSALIATVVSPETDMETISLIHERLMLARGIIRASVAGVIHRKRVPQIQFRIIPDNRI